MPPISFKACPRCDGDLHQQADIYGKYLTCLQCGYSVDQSGDDSLYERLVKPSKDTREAHPTQPHSGPCDEIIDTSS